MTVEYVDPKTGTKLSKRLDEYVSNTGGTYPVLKNIPRFCPIANYTDNFGKQWNRFDTTQMDGLNATDPGSGRRFFLETGWTPQDLDGADILEVGSGAGRFSRVILQKTKAYLHSIDYSNAVEANLRVNGSIAPARFRLAQASLYELPFPDGAFDKVVCLGVLQHTPDFAASIRALVHKAKPGGEIVVDFYPVTGWWTKIHAKYIFRPVSRRMNHERLLGLIERNVGWLMRLSDVMHRSKIGALTRFLPLVDQRTLPSDLRLTERREWSVLDTFDQYSPEHDHPQRLADVKAMFEQAGAHVTFAGFIDIGSSKAAVVRAVRKPSMSQSERG